MATIVEFSLFDHMQSIRLLCPDFDAAPYRHASAFIPGNTMDSLCTFTVASAHWQLFFVYREFMAKLRAVFLDSQTSEIDATSLAKNLTLIENDLKGWPAPPMSILQTAAEAASGVSLSTLVAALVASPDVVRSVVPVEGHGDVAGAGDA
jgi:hypothetical protein